MPDSKTTIYFQEGFGTERYRGVLIETVRGEPVDGMITFVFEGGKTLSIWESRIQRITKG